jgi:hypothetical protein
LAQIIKIAGGIILAVAVLYGFISWRNTTATPATTATSLSWKTGAYSFRPMSKAGRDGRMEAG